MKTDDQKNQVLLFPNEEYEEFLKKTKLSKNCVRHICRHGKVKKPMKKGPTRKKKGPIS